MACFNGTANTVQELFYSIVTFITDNSNFAGQNAWTVVSPEVFDQNTREVILKGVGDGQDEIYIGMKIVTRGSGQEDIAFNGFAGFDPGLAWYEQPGAIPENAKLPCVPLAKDVFMTYWLVANTSRFAFVVEMSNHYESAYAGFIQPIAVERQYPYPLVIGGSAISGTAWNSRDNAHSFFLKPVLDGSGASSLCLRRPDGVWKFGGSTLKVWPMDTNPVDTFTVYQENDDDSVMKEHMQFSTLLYETNPVGMIGEFMGLYFIGNRADLAAKDNVIYQDKVYKVFNNVFRRDDDAYFVIEWS